MTTNQAILGIIRAPFLILGPACVLLGVAAASHFGESINLLHVFLLILGALLAHISVNALNEYADFKSGLDELTVRTPFSGGSGTLPESPEYLNLALGIGIASLLVVVGIGVSLALSDLPMLWLIGGLGVLVVGFYTPWINKVPLLCLLSPGLGFGLLMIVGSYYVLTKDINAEIIFLALPSFFLVNNLLLLNQFPDEEADRQVGRHHILIAKGKVFASKVFVLGIVLAYASLLIGVLAFDVPSAALIGYLTLMLAIPVALGVLQHAENTEALMPLMGKNVLIVVGTPLLMAMGLFLA